MDTDLPIVFEKWLEENGLIYNRFHSTNEKRIFIYPDPSSGDHIEFAVDWSTPAQLTVSISPTSPHAPSSKSLRRPKRASQAKALIWLYGIGSDKYSDITGGEATTAFLTLLQQNGFTRFSSNAYVKTIDEASFHVTIHSEDSTIDVDGFGEAESWTLPVPQTEEYAKALLWLHGLNF